MSTTDRDKNYSIVLSSKFKSVQRFYSSILQPKIVQHFTMTIYTNLQFNLSYNFCFEKAFYLYIESLKQN